MSTFADQIVADIKKDGAEGDIVDRIRIVADIMAPHIPETDEVLKRAAFFNADDSEASIVIQCLDADRRLNVNAWTPGKYDDWLEVSTIDEDMKTVRKAIPIYATGTIEGLVSWVTGKTDRVGGFTA